MKKLIITLILSVIATSLFAQSLPPRGIRYGDLIPRADEENDVGHSLVKWRSIYGLEAFFQDLDVRSLTAETITADEGIIELVESDEITADHASIVHLTGNERNIEATLPASAFIDGTATFDGMNWYFPEGSATTASSVFFQIPQNYDISKDVISITIGWEGSNSNTGNASWEIFLYGARSGEAIGEVGVASATTPNSGSGLLNISSWSVMDTPNLDEEFGVYIEIVRYGGGPYSSGDTFTGDVKLHYIQVRIPVKNI